MRITRRTVLQSLFSLAAGSAIWMPTVHLVFGPSREERSATSTFVQRLLNRHLALWEGEASIDEVATMRVMNPEWDFMGRTFLVLALANLCFHNPNGQHRYLSVIDRIIDDTLATEAERGMHYFLMAYSRSRPFIQQPPRSAFLDGEIALMLGARRLVEDDTRYAEIMNARADTIAERMLIAPVHSLESYPDECWTFCNTTALAALKIQGVLDERDHQPLFDQWLNVAQEELVDPETGLLISEYTYNGHHLDGPEGSSIWWSAHCLLPVNAVFARQQYENAKQQLGASLLGFGWSREWPRSWVGPTDIDSGPIVPVLEVSAGASGHAVLAASIFGDEDYLDELLGSVDLAAFPIEDESGLRFGAGNQVGDALLLYALVCGPLWDEIERRAS